MVKSNIEEKELIPYTKVMTGDDYQHRNMLYQLRLSIRKAKRIDMVVAFLKQSGLKLIINDLRYALENGAQINILTGVYLGITEPQALYYLKNEFEDQIQIKIYHHSNKSFHPKAYFFHYENYSELLIGSSNLTYSALTNGIEWNYRFTNEYDKQSFDEFYNIYLDLFHNHSTLLDDKVLKDYSSKWKKNHLLKEIEKYEIKQENDQVFEPRGAQIEALYALKQTRKEGAKKALVQAATGIGKTYLAAFDSQKYQKVLFVAHQEEILKQAANSFYNVRKSLDYGFFDGNNKTSDKSVIFASVATLGKEEYLNDQYFSKDYFNYIIIDEFHHAASKNYQNIVNYFKPDFLLGLTATPERMDGKNIYAICDYNAPYEITLKDAINKGMLVPFHYYGIYDEIDYSNIKYVKGKYDEEQLTDIYINNQKRFELIYKHYLKHPSKQALGFCCSKKHALEMTKYFIKKGIKAVAVYSNANEEDTMQRDEAIAKLKKEEIQIIFSVDMFNEGVDITSVDMVMFLRPTQSPIVFLQQLGRGLRLHEGKQYLNVLDFIGNYEKCNKIPSFLTGSQIANQYIDMNYFSKYIPDGCIVDFDLTLIDLFKEMDKKTISMKQKIRNEYQRIKELLQVEIVTRVDLFKNMDDTIYDYCTSHTQVNICRDYLDFLLELKVIDSLDDEIYHFLRLLETTNMTKVYKMPVLLAFYNDGSIQPNLKEEDVLLWWKTFFNQGLNWRDLENVKCYQDYLKLNDKEHLKKIKKMPIKFLKQSSKSYAEKNQTIDCFIEKENYLLSLNPVLEQYIHSDFLINQMKDIIEYRILDYYKRRYGKK